MYVAITNSSRLIRLLVSSVCHVAKGSVSFFWCNFQWSPLSRDPQALATRQARCPAGILGPMLGISVFLLLGLASCVGGARPSAFTEKGARTIRCVIAGLCAVVALISS